MSIVNLDPRVSLHNPAALAMMFLSLAPIGGFANEIASQLFLAPSAVPVATYAPIVLDSTGSYTFNASMAGGSAINDVAILPFLTANPNSADGSYTDAQLAAINVSNYSGFFAFSPTTDYTASDPGGASNTVTFNQSGMYYVQLQTNAGSSLFQVLVNTDLAGTPKPTGPGEAITPPPNDGTTIISAGDPDDPVHTKDGNIIPGAMVMAQQQLTNAQTALTIGDLIQDIKNQYKANGNKKFVVNIIGHGFPGGLDIGATQTIGDPGNPNKPAGRTAMSVTDFQALIDPYVSAAHFYSCSSAYDGWGQSFLDELSASLGLASGYTAPVWISNTGFWADTQGKLVTSVSPEPGSIWMLLLGIPVALSRRRRA